MQEVLIEGPTGALEAVWRPSDADVAAILCHPHPQYGGSMHDMVLDAVDQALMAAGVSSLKFNFRGVGRSEGEYDNGVGEVDDVVAVANWIRQTTSATRLKLIGYSFGGAIALAVTDQIQADELILAAPAIGMFGTTPAPEQRSLVVIGDQDQFVPVSTVTDFFRDDVTQVEILPGVDHFFMGAHGQLTEVVAGFL